MGKKIALCLSGQARFVDKGYHESLAPLLLSGNDVDVFIHTWAVGKEQENKPYVNAGGHNMGDNVTQQTVDDYLYLYEPKRFLVEKQINFPYGEWSDRAMPAIRSDYGYSMLYSLYVSNKLRKIYERENNIEYDIIVRSRSDVFIPEFDFENMEDKLYLPTGCPHYRGVADCFAVGKSEYIDLYSDLYFHVKDIMENTDIQLCWELLLYHHLTSNNVPLDISIPHKLYR